jgi:FkbM family methyltransferase
MRDRVETAIPGRAAIELVSFYEEFRNYYPQCEMETKQWFVQNVRPDWWIFDVGANIGYYSILFSQLAPDGRVLAFEPTSTAKMLRKNLKHNDTHNVEVHEVAIGAVTGSHRDRIYRLWGTDGEAQVYPFYKIDDFLAEKAIERIDCIKIDVDSFDFEVLRGAEQTLQKRNPLIVVELNHALSKRNQSAGEALAWLAHRGYQKALVLDHDNFVLCRGRDIQINVSGSKKLELVFPPPMRFDESIDNLAGVKISPLLKIARLQNGAKFVSTSDVGERPSNAPMSTASSSSKPATILDAIRRLFKRQVAKQNIADGAIDLTLIMGREIQTSAPIWSYALVLEFDLNSLRSLVPHSLLAVEVAAEVIEGKLGIVLGGEDPSNFCSSERTMVAMPEVQCLIAMASTSSLRRLILRNVAPEGGKTVFKLVSIQAKATHPS